MHLSVRHELSITPPPGTANLVLQVLLTPRNGAAQKVEDWTVDMPGMAEAAHFTDAYGNAMLLVNQSRPEGALDIVVTGQVETKDRNGVLGRAGGEPVPALYKRLTPLTKAPATLYSPFVASKESRLDILHGLMRRVGDTLGGGERAQQAQMAADGSQSQSQASKPVAPAHDQAHAFIGACRALDIPARYITGYWPRPRMASLPFTPGPRPLTRAWAGSALIRCCSFA
jgi:transglutaminase-like putative cysteine protease